VRRPFPEQRKGVIFSIAIIGLVSALLGFSSWTDCSGEEKQQESETVPPELLQSLTPALIQSSSAAHRA